ncbi:MAG TPA: Gmad2 immunoglobulin-like domain-containing protein, partial [Acidimicrobiia bacterium]
CGGTTTAPSTILPPGTGTTTPSSSTSAPQSIGCPQDAEFIDEGRIARITQPSSDAKTLGLISIQTAEGCERFGFNFETNENAPATTPPSIDGEFLDNGGIVRIYMDIDQTVLTDQLVETPLVDRLFVVRSLDGSMFVDVHLARPARARINVTNSPAGMTLELSPRDGELPPSAAISDRVVLITPRSEAVVDGPVVDVGGYARTFEANVLVLATVGGAVVARTNTTAADWVSTWGEFATEIELPAGLDDLFVGEESPENGSLTGVTIRLTVR